MRLLLCTALCFPVAALAETFVIPSRASEAVIYPEGGLVTHVVSVTADAGQHQIILPDLPDGIAVDLLRISAPDLRLGAIRYRADLAPPRPNPDSPAVEAARARIKEIEARIQSVRDTAERAKLAADAAEAKIAFLTGLGGNENLPSDPETLRAISRMVDEETLAARQSAFDAAVTARATQEQIENLRKDLEAARQELAALVPEPRDRPQLVITVSAAAAVTDVKMRVTYLAPSVGWVPTYDLRLTDGDTPQLQIGRGVVVRQDTGENWKDVRLTLSTAAPSGQFEASYLPQDSRRVFEPSKNADLQRSTTRLSGADAIEAPVVQFEAAPAVQRQGLALTYRFKTGVDIASGADDVTIPFDTLSFDATLRARAVPLQDATAYLVAEFTNTSPEPLLNSSDTLHFFDGGLVAVGQLPDIAAGETVEIGFGPIDGLQLERRVLARNEGDRGIITRSNEQTEDVRITVKNLTDRTWDMELLDRVPYSEQEELQITYAASPQPNIRDVNDRRGILQWNMVMQPGDETTIETGFKITWPDGMIMR